MSYQERPMLYAILTYSNMCPAPYPSKMNPRLYFPLVAAARCKECFYNLDTIRQGFCIMHYLTIYFRVCFKASNLLWFYLIITSFLVSIDISYLTFQNAISLRINQNSITVLFELSMKLYSLTYSSTISCSSRISI